MSDDPPRTGSQGSFSQGVGEWIGGAKVYDADGQFIGPGRDTRTVTADDGSGTVTVDVTFDGPFTLSGRYTIVDRTTHRLYTGPLNIGYAEAVGSGLVCAHNYWHDLGLNQRFFLMVLPDGSRQLSLAILSRGEQPRFTVVGEYRRRVSPDDTAPVVGAGASAGPALLHRPGRWTGDLTVTDADLAPAGSTHYVETLTPADPDAALHGAGSLLHASAVGCGFTAATEHEMYTDGRSSWTPAGDVVGSYSLSGGRGLSGTAYFPGEGLRCWRREVASSDGTTKAVVNQWYRGEQRIGMTYGTLDFDPADG